MTIETGNALGLGCPPGSAIQLTSLVNLIQAKNVGLMTRTQCVVAAKRILAAYNDFKLVPSIIEECKK